MVDFHTDAHGWISSSKLPEAMPRGAFAGALGAGAGASAMVWLPLWGLPLAFAGRGAARWGGYRFCAFVVMCRAALRRVRAAVARAFGVSVALAAQLSISAGSSAGSATEVWSGAAGDVFYRPSSAIGMCAGGMVAFWAHGGPKVTILFARCMMTSPRTGRALLARSGRAFAISRGVFEQLALPVSSSSHDCCQDEGCWSSV